MLHLIGLCNELILSNLPMVWLFDADNGCNQLPETLIRDTDSGGFEDPLVSVERIFDRNRIDVFASADDNVLDWKRIE